MSKLPKPLRRKEYYLDKLAKQAMGEEVTKAMPKPLTRTETYLNALANNAKMLPQVTSEDNGNVLAVVNGAWAKSAPVSPIAVFSVTFKDFDSSTETYQHVYWGENDTTHEIVEGVSEYCAELDQAMADEKAIMIKAYVGDKQYNLVPTSVSYLSDAYHLRNDMGTPGSDGNPYYLGLNGGWERFNYTKNESSTKDGKFTAILKLSIT